MRNFIGNSEAGSELSGMNYEKNNLNVENK
jgi:hypothetical protein